MCALSCPVGHNVIHTHTQAHKQLGLKMLLNKQAAERLELLELTTIEERRKEALQGEEEEAAN